MHCKKDKNISLIPINKKKHSHLFCDLSAKEHLCKQPVQGLFNKIIKNP